jgi:hypothetical protein
MDSSDTDTSDEHPREPAGGPDVGAAAGSLPVEQADNGEPVIDPDADEDAAGRAAAAKAERIERHEGGDGG